MTGKRSSTSKKKSSSAGKKKAPARSTADQVPVASEDERASAARRSAKSIEANDQAVPEGAPLRRGATHEVVGREEDGTPILKRRRFSIS